MISSTHPPDTIKFLRHLKLLTNRSPKKVSVGTGSCQSWRKPLYYKRLKHILYLDNAFVKRYKACWTACALPLSNAILSANSKPKVLLLGRTLNPLFERPDRDLLEKIYDKVEKNADIRHACRTALKTTKNDESWTEALDRPEVWRYNSLRIDAHFSDTLFPNKQYHSAELLVQSKAARMSKITVTVGFWKVKRCVNSLYNLLLNQQKSAITLGS